MARVVFAFGSNPDLSATEALDLAEFLVRRRNYASYSVGVRIRDALDPDRPDDGVSALITLTPDEMEQIAAVLDETPVLSSAPRVAHLRNELRAATEAAPEPELPALRPPRTAQPPDRGPEPTHDAPQDQRMPHRRAS